MKAKKNKLLILIILGIGILVLINTKIEFRGYQKSIVTSPKESGGYNESFIHIDGNWTVSTSYGWCYGQGTWQEPYIIENVTINAGGTGSGILIENSKDEYFIIRNCTIFNSGSNTVDAGIKLVNVSNGIIFNNSCFYNANHGILMYTNCNNNTLKKNIVNYNLDGGIYLESTCYENVILNNTANNNAVGIMVINTVAGISHHNNILNNTIEENGVGIWLAQSDYNTVSGNQLFNNSRTTFGTAGNGIRITFYDWGGKSQHNIIENNIITYSRYGIFMYDGDNNTITDNVIIHSSIHGIYFRTEQTGFNCEDNIIANNTVNYNSEHGIYLNYLCSYNTINNNTINNNGKYGIYLGSSSNQNNITENKIQENLCGILLSSSNNNNVSENHLISNVVCIFEEYCTGNILENNICLDSIFQSPILIDGAATGVGAHNCTWAASQPWCKGSGTELDPYIIENLVINGLGITEGIEILNSNEYFTIQGCTISNADTAIYLDTVINAQIIGNNFSNNDNGIHIEYSDNNFILGNFLNNNDWSGCYLYESNNTIINQNFANGNYDGIYLDTECFSNIITNNTVNNNNDGIYLYYRCDHNNISRNVVNNNEYYGIYLEDCQDNLILNNTVNNTGDYGIHIDLNSRINIISGNSVTYNEYGIFLGDSSDNNSIWGNFVNYNYLGIYLEEFSDNNSISDNSLYYNELGIRLFLNCCNNTLSGNFVCNTIFDGIILETGCENNTLSENNIRNNGAIGIKLVEACDFNIISENILYNNDFGININSADYNSVYSNFFLNNGIHAKDDGNDNTWNTTSVGNYWDNHTSPDLSPHNGIVDTPYIFISGSAGSIDYLPIAEDGAPRIRIISPAVGSTFGANAPSFVVEIVDDYLYEIWYTLDDGLHNYTFTEFIGTIDQSAWDNLAEGLVTLRFYASDIPGNIAFTEVKINKSVGLDPGVIAIIVIFSIIGGLAIVSVILWFLLKKGKISLEKLKNFSIRNK